MVQSQAAISILKVNINCCDKCRSKAKEKLQKIDGVEFIEYDSERVLKISGKINPMNIVKKVEKWGKKAEVLSLQQSLNSTDSVHHESKSEIHNDDCCHCDLISDSDFVNQDSEVCVSNESNPNITLNKQSRKSKPKKGCLWLFGLFCKKKSDEVTLSREPSMANGPLKWQFPRIPMLEYGGPRPYYQPFQSCYPPMMGRPLGPSYYPFSVMRSPPRYGVFNSRPPLKVNPMIHYTSYADNYSPW
ncbi:hypothetical protein E1A91_A01G010800v1 [Gossypium mustelinum]|uniref:HMA domain-containing protein n=1 Tax=Gossypium mustelinum TaxID=34275 RepID=A0A5D3A7X2_GOSMU|nr:hypothetical protein E1A91_A01G010800v1 [Gossypium mustelinum]